MNLIPRPGALLCAGCELGVAWPPVERGARAHCCTGCAAGGPCCCSYDDVQDARPELEDMMLDQRGLGGSAAQGRWIPMTPEAFRRVQTEVDRLAARVDGSQATAWLDGLSGDSDAPTFVANGELHLLTERLKKLRAALAAARVAQPDGRALVGSRVTIAHPDGSQDRYTLVAPGEADARAGRISAESPLGAALLGRRVGEAAEFDVAADRRSVTVLSVT